MKKFITNKYVLEIIGILLFLTLWEIISLVVDHNGMIFPDVFKTIKETINVLSDSYVYKCLGSSLFRLLIGFIAAFILALILGIFASMSSNIKKIFEPTITALKSLPTAAIVFLLLILVGARNASIFMVSIVSFPILYESVVGGIENIDPDLLDAAKVDGINSFSKTVRFKLPLAFPYIVIGLASSFGLSLKIEIMSEIISGDTGYGLGSAILVASRNDPSNLTPVFAYSLIAIIIVLLFTLITRILKK